jgi:hypothetical protein
LDARERLLRAALLLLDNRDESIEVLKYELWVAEVNLQKEIEAKAHAEPEIKFAKQPLYMSEEQEDVQWQLDNDLISTQAAESLLRELEFENAEVHLDEDFTYENFHTT